MCLQKKKITHTATIFRCLYKIFIANVTGQEPGNFHIIILNDNLNKAYAELREFISQNVKDVDQGMCCGDQTFYLS